MGPRKRRKKRKRCKKKHETSKRGKEREEGKGCKDVERNGGWWRRKGGEGGRGGKEPLWFASSPSDVVILQNGSIDYVPRFSTFGQLYTDFFSSFFVWTVDGATRL